MENSEFMNWFNELVEYAGKTDLCVNTEDPESYREYFEDGYSPEEAVREDNSYLD